MLTSRDLLPQQAPMFTSQSDELEFTEEEGRRFGAENAMLHRHFQENLEDAKWVGLVVLQCCLIAINQLSRFPQKDGVQNGRNLEPHGSICGQNHGAADRYRDDSAPRLRDKV